MKFKILILILSIWFSKSYAHDSKEAFFTISKTENAIIVKADFPWTIRNALFKFKPELANTRDKTSIENAFFEYVKLNLILKNKQENLLKLIHITEDTSIGHSHETKYIFTFENDKIFKVDNRLMFNLNDEQVNYHTILINNKSSKYSTTKEHPIFNLGQKHASKMNLYWLIFLIAFLVLIPLYRKISTANKGLMK